MANDVWTIKSALDWTVDYLDRKGDENPRLSAQWLLAAACNLSRIELYTHYEQPLSAEERDVLHGYVAQRGRGEPLQYITGEVGFRHITLKVRPGVLIPRPETEILVSEALALLPPASYLRVEEEIDPGASDESLGVEPQHLLVADIGSGSGCIACSLAFEHPGVQVVATDIEPAAVALTRENAADLKLDDRIDVLECDLGKGIDTALMGQFDLVVSNPPYIPTAALSAMSREVADFEPALALDGGSDGLDVFDRLLSWCVCALKPGGALAVELFETTLDEAAQRAVQAGFTDVRTVCDLTNRPRVLTARKAENTA